MKKSLAVLFSIFLMGGLLGAQGFFGPGNPPPKPKLALAWAPGSGPQAGTLVLTYSIPQGYHQTLQPEFLTLDPQGSSGITWASVQYPQGKQEGDLVNYYGTIEIRRSFTAAPPLTAPLEVQVTTQLCNEEGLCFPPQTQTLRIDPPQTSPLDLGTLGFFFLLALLGGLILNVMPCVFPVLSLKAFSLVKQAQGDSKTILASALAYTGGILMSFWTLVGVIIALKFSGDLVGWGFQFQNPWFVVILAGVMFLFALSLFDVFVISAPVKLGAAKPGASKGLTGAFFSGLLAVVLATPCTAPFLGSALGFAFAQPPLVVLGIFTFIGLGLALPFLLIGFFPKVLKLIPKPGPWMDVFKNLMGFFLLGTVVWLAWVYGSDSGSRLVDLLVFLLSLGLVAWFYGRFYPTRQTSWGRWVFLGITILALAGAGFYSLPKLTAPMVPGTSGASVLKPADWETFDPVKIQQTLDQGQPVFVDFGAKWCVTCTVNEQTVLFTPEAQERFAKAGVKKFFGDFTYKDPVILDWLLKYGSGAVPLDLLFIPGNPQPHRLPELLSMGDLKAALGKLP